MGVADRGLGLEGGAGDISVVGAVRCGLAWAEGRVSAVSVRDVCVWNGVRSVVGAKVLR